MEINTLLDRRQENRPNGRKRHTCKNQLDNILLRYDERALRDEREVPNSKTWFNKQFNVGCFQKR